MIPVALQPEPHNFEANVRARGAVFLAATPHPNHEQFKKANYWKHAAKEIYEAYSRICAYTCRYIDTPNGSIDHFNSKSGHPQQAYEWKNYRLSMHRVNGYKGNSIDVIDPFHVMPGWFTIDFPSCLVKPGDGLDAQTHDRVMATIRTLKLNDDDSFVQDRCDLMFDFATQNISLAFLTRIRPFLGAEIIRQGIEDTVADLFKMPP